MLNHKHMLEIPATSVSHAQHCQQSADTVYTCYQRTARGARCHVLQILVGNCCILTEHCYIV